MIDFTKIGKRILEERKYLRRISQEKMAEDLGMYQADISNLEKAKNGSGITNRHTTGNGSTLPSSFAKMFETEI